MQSAYQDDVNLIPQEVINEKARQTHKKSIDKVAITILIIVVIATIAVVGYNQTLKSKLKNINNAIAVQEKIVEDLKEFGVIGYSLGVRLEKADKVMNERNRNSTLMEEINKRIPEGVELSNYSYAGGNVVNLTGRAFANYTPIAEFKDNLLSDSSDKGALFKDAKIVSASYTNDQSSIAFSIDIYLHEGALNNAKQ